MVLRPSARVAKVGMHRWFRSVRQGRLHGATRTCGNMHARAASHTCGCMHACTRHHARMRFSLGPWVGARMVGVVLVRALTAGLRRLLEADRIHVKRHDGLHLQYSGRIWVHPLPNGRLRAYLGWFKLIVSGYRVNGGRGGACGRVDRGVTQLDHGVGTCGSTCRLNDVVVHRLRYRDSNLTLLTPRGCLHGSLPRLT